MRQGCQIPLLKDARSYQVTKVEEAISSLLREMGRDPDLDEGVRDTPARVQRMFNEFRARQDLSFSTFAANGTDQMVVIDGIQFYSFCEHHLLPFYGTAVVGYIPDPNGKICGLSKVARVVDKFSLRPQTQEYLTNQVADFLETNLGAQGCGVVMRAEHLCMAMRGVRKQGSTTVTSSLRGAILNEPETRAEFLALARIKNG